MIKKYKDSYITEARCNNLTVKEKDNMCVEQVLEIISEEKHGQMNIFDFI